MSRRTVIGRERMPLLAASLLMCALAMAFTFAPSAGAQTGTQCARTSLESLATDQASYPPGETVYISGSGFAIGCDVEIRITRPDGVVESAIVSTAFGSELTHEYILPPPPGVLGIYVVEAIGLDGAVLATHTFTDGPEIKNPDVVPGWVTTGGARRFSLLVRNTGDTTHKCIRVTIPSGYTVASDALKGSSASTGAWTTASVNTSTRVITLTDGTGIAPGSGWARFDIEVTPTSSSDADWSFRAWSNVGCNSDGTSSEGVRVVANASQPPDRRYTAQFVNSAGATITPTVGPGTNTYRLKLTKSSDSQSNTIAYFGVAVPLCFTNLTVTNSGANSVNGSSWTATVVDNFLRWTDPSSGELNDGQSVTVTFDANTGSCTGSQSFMSAGWEDNVGSAAGSPSKLFTATAHPTVTVSSDSTAPTVLSINRDGSSPTNTSGSVSWTVTFDESVTGVDMGDFALVNSGLGGSPAITGVTGTGTTRTVTASSGTGSGTLGLNLNDHDDSIVDGAGNKLGGTGTGTAGSGGTGNGSLVGQVYTIDRTAPVIGATAVTLPDLDPYTADTWTNKTVRVTFNCTDSGGSGTATTTANGSTDVTSETTGTTVNSSGACTDNAGNSAAAASFGPIKIDTSDPASSADSPAVTNASPFTVDYSANDQATLSGLEKVELYVRTPEAGTGYVLAATDTSPSASGSFSYAPTAGDGEYRFYTRAYDAAGNAEEPAAIYDTGTQVETGEPDDTTLYDTVAPVTTDDADGDWHNTDVTVTLTPTDTDGSGVATTYYKVDGDATFTEGTSVVIPAPADHSNDGTHTITYYSVDVAGNQETDKTATVKIDTTAPTVASIVRADADPTNTTGPVSWDVTFSESVSGVDETDFALANSGLGGSPAITGVTGTGATRTVTASSGTGDGTLRLNLNDDDTISDVASNELGGTGTGSVGSGGAGNGSHEGEAYTIDRTAPVIAATAVTLPGSAPYTAGTWTNLSVRVTFDCTDTGGAGKATDSASGSTDVVAETTAAGTTVDSSGTCTDNAGNTATGTSFGPIKIDTTDPVITDLGPTTSANGNGWYDADVDNEFQAADGLSGLDADCLTAFPDDGSGDRVQTKTTSGQGNAVTVDSDSCTDDAGNTADPVTSAAFKIDMSDPTSSADSPAVTNDSPFTVGYTASDQDGLSGVARVELYVRTPEAGTGYVLADADTSPSPTGSFSYAPTAGDGEYRFYTVAYDAAGNVETSPVTYDTITDIESGIPDDTTLYDTTAPVTTDDADSDWHNTAVTVTLTPTDSDGSGVDKTFYKVDSALTYTEGTSVVIPAPADHSNDGTHTIAYYSVDVAGNQESDQTATVKIDTVAPQIARDTGADTCDVPGDDGWCRGTQTAGFTATDGLSGLATDGAASRDFTKTSSTDGAAVQIASASVSDRAGNVASSIDAGPFMIDGTDPTVTCETGATFTLGATPASVSATVADATSGPAATPVSASADTGTVGTRTVDVTGEDEAGNSDTATCSYKVEYGWNGFLQPINDTAHQTGLTQSRFKLGSTIPAKFVITNAAGQVVQQATAPTFKRTNRLRACDETLTSEPTASDLSPDGDGTYNWDGSKYQYNWSTKGIKQTGVYRIYASLADGNDRWVDICLW